MKFQFESLMDFLAMDGHGVFVWACYLITLVTILVLIVIPRQEKRQLHIQMQRQQRIEQAAMANS